MQTDYKLITVREVSEILGISNSSIYRRINEKGRFYDPLFPKPLKLGESSSRWVRSEIFEWIQRNLDGRESA